MSRRRTRENRQERCIRCMVINQKHVNILQYKESEWSIDSPLVWWLQWLLQSSFFIFLFSTYVFLPAFRLLPLLLASAFSLTHTDSSPSFHSLIHTHSLFSLCAAFCFPASRTYDRNLRDVCTDINGDAPLYSLFRRKYIDFYCSSCLSLQSSLNIHRNHNRTDNNSWSWLTHFSLLPPFLSVPFHSLPYIVVFIVRDSVVTPNDDDHYFLQWPYHMLLLLLLPEHITSWNTSMKIHHLQKTHLLFHVLLPGLLRSHTVGDMRSVENLFPVLIRVPKRAGCSFDSKRVPTSLVLRVEVSSMSSSFSSLFNLRYPCCLLSLSLSQSCPILHFPRWCFTRVQFFSAVQTHTDIDMQVEERLYVITERSQKREEEKNLPSKGTKDLNVIQLQTRGLETQENSEREEWSEKSQRCCKRDPSGWEMNNAEQGKMKEEGTKSKGKARIG